jgi:hypothetical protein
MSYRKTKLIQEKNMLLERKYILEQGPIPPPPAPAPSTGTPPPAPSTPTPPTSSEMTSFEIKSVKEFDKDENKNRKCSKMTIPQEIKSQTPKTISGDSKNYQYYLTKDNSQLFCYDLMN